MASVDAHFMIIHFISFQGGFVFLTSESCPWLIEFDRTETYFYDRLSTNIWNARGNGWRLAKVGDFEIECFDERLHEAFDCGCKEVTVKSSTAAAAEEEESMGA